MFRVIALVTGRVHDIDTKMGIRAASPTRGRVGASFQPLRMTTLSVRPFMGGDTFLWGMEVCHLPPSL